MYLRQNQCPLTLLKPSPCTGFPFQPSLLRKTVLKYLSVHLRYEYVSPLYFLTKNNYDSLRDCTLWNLLLAGERGLFDKVISLAVLDNASNRRHQTAQMTQTIISPGYYPYSQLRNIGCYPLRKCETGESRRSRLYANDFERERQTILVPSNVKLVQQTSRPS